MELVERELTVPWEGVLVEPAGGSRTGVVVLLGSSGRVDRERARVLAGQGVMALSIRWYGGPGQPPGICEVPLETFTAAVDLLKERGAERIAILGTSKGAEAAMLTAVRDPRVDVVVALAPTSVVWGNVGPGLDGRERPYRSSWSWRGEPVPFVPVDDTWLEGDHGPEPVAILGWYEQSERTFAARLEAAAIPVEQARADLVLVAGGDDEMWPALRYAQELAGRRRAVGAPVELISSADAGHRIRLPGESPAAPMTTYAYGGTPEADARLGRAAWEPILDRLRRD
ncbi:acyl-CoA thioester hydrolase/BAAT C-terminal domain-containing protein [Kitasatospora sp. NPDC002227]|uniref:acyl-CoA thioester hydrolase/BAAT C-terminal domain-containing protein n=1 Tax=Kitasatospora sp. NPDC002227 TaxID=3154773 RepID=UPI00332A1660